jgi:hypothetical protein
LPFDLSEVTIAGWSYILITCLSDSRPVDTQFKKLPAVFGFVPLVQLGFVKEVADYVNTPLLVPVQSPSPVLLELQAGRPELETWIGAMQARRAAERSRPGVIVVTDSSSQLTTEWKPSAKYAAIVTNSFNLARLRQALQPIWRQNLVTRLIFEIPPVTSLTTSLPPPTPSVLSGFPELLNLPYSYLSAIGPSSPIPTGVPLIISPRTLDDAVDLAPAATPPPNKLNL